MNLEGDSLSQQPHDAVSDSSLELPPDGQPVVVYDAKPRSDRLSLSRYNTTAFLITGLTILVIAFIGVGSLWLAGSHGNKPNKAGGQGPASYAVGSLPLNDVKGVDQLQAGQADQLAINGRLRVSNSLVLVPGGVPSSPTAGQIYYDSGSNAPYYYNGTQFISLAPTATPQHVTSIAGASGNLSLGNGLSLSGNNIVNGGVLSLQGTSDEVNVSAGTGNIVLSLPQGIATGSSPTFAGLTVPSLSLPGAGNSITLPADSGTICLSSGNCGALSNAALLNANNIFTGNNTFGAQLNANGGIVTNNADINAGTGTITGNGSGLTNLNASNLTTGTVADSLLSADVTLQGNTFNGVSELVQTTPAGALPVLSGVNLTSLNGSAITTGTVADNRLSANVTLQGNVFNGANQLVQLNGSSQLPAVSGVNLTDLDASNINSGTLGVLNGGTGAGTAAGARSNLGAAASGTNGDITSLTALTAITPSAALTIGSTGEGLTLQGSTTTLSDTAGGFTTTLGFASPTANQTITLPNDSGTVCLTSGNCLGGGGGGANTELSNLGTTAINANLLPSGNGVVSLGAGGNGFSNLYVSDASNTYTYNLVGNTTTADKTVAIPDFAGSSATLCLSTGNCAGSGSGVTTSGGTINTIPVYSGTQQIGNSILSQDAGATTLTVGGAETVSGQLNANGGIVTNNADINAGTGTITGNGSGLSSLNASNISSGTLNDSRLSANVTLQGNTFNGINELVQLDGSGALPSLSGANLTSLNGSAITTGTVADNRLSANVALLNANQTFSGNNTFKPATDSAIAFRIQNALGTTTLFDADTTGSGALTFGVPAGFSSTLTVTGVTNANGGLATGGANITTSGGTVNGQTISSAASFTGTVAVATLGSAGNTPICLNGSDQLGSCNANTAVVSLQGAYDNSVSPQITLSAAEGGLVVQDASTPLGGDLLVVQSNGGGSKYLEVTASSTTVGNNLSVTGNGTVGGLLTGSDGLTVTGAGSSLSGGTINLNASSNNATNINTGSSTGAVNIGNSAAGAIGLTSSSTVSIQAGTGSNAISIGTTAAVNQVLIGSTNSTSSLTLRAGSNNANVQAGTFSLQDASGNHYFDFSGNTLTCGAFTTSSTNPCTLQAGGALTLNGVAGSGGGNGGYLTLTTGSVIVNTHSSNSATAFEVQNNNGYNVLDANTSTGTVTLGNVTSTSGHGVAGQLLLADGTADNFAATLNTTTLTANRTITIPDAGGTICIIGSASCGASGTGYILNQTSSTQTGGFNVSGAGSLGGLLTGTAGATISGAAANINASSNFATNINTGSSTGSVAIGSTAGSNGLTERVGTGNYSLDGVAGSTYTIGASTTTGTIAIGGGAQTGSITLGNSTGTNSILIGNGSGATTVNIANANAAGAVNVGSGFTTGTVSIGGGSQTGNITLGNSSGTNLVLIANGSGASSVNISNANTAGTVNVGGSYTTGSINIGGSAETGTITLGSSSGTNTLNIAGGTGATTLNLADVQNAGSVNIGAGMTTGTINIGGTGAQTGTIAIGTGTGVQSLTFGTGGTGAKTVTVGSTASTGTTTIQAGTGGVIVKPATSTAAFQVQNAGGASALTVDTTDLRVDVGTTGTPTSQLYVSGTMPSAVLASVSTGSSSGPKDVYVQGRYAYVVDNSTSKLLTFDVSNPASPTQIGSGVSTSGNPNALYVQGRYAYVINSVSNLQIFDISDPASPSSVGSVSTSGVPQAIYVAGRYAYVVNNTNTTLQIFDVSNPAKPLAVGSASTGSSPDAVYVQGRYAYVLNRSSNTMQIFDVSNPASPAQVAGGSVSVGAFPSAVYVQGRYAFVVSSSASTIQSIDISNPASPTFVDNSTTSSGAISLYVQGRYAYVVANSGALNIFDISDPTNISSNLVTLSIGGTPNWIYVQGRYAYVANTGSNTMQTFDLGGAYVQQLEAGGIETGTLSTDSNAAIGGDEAVQGGLSVGQNAQINGNLGVSGQTTVATTSTAAFQVQNASGTAALNVDTTDLTVTTQAGTDIGTLGSNLAPTNFSTGWTGTNWTLTSSTAAHVSGHTNTLSPTTALATTSGKLYEVSYTITNPTTAGSSLTVALGATNITTYNFDANDTGTYSFTDEFLVTAPSTNANLVFTPSSNFTGTISGPFVAQLTQNTNPALVVKNASGSTSIEVRATNNTDQLFIGNNAGMSDVSGVQNTAVGADALQNNIDGSWNSAFGFGALRYNTDGSNNTALGYTALNRNTSGSYNTAVGLDALNANTIGIENTAVGENALQSNVDGSQLTAVGNLALQMNTTGYGNTALGQASLEFNTTGYNNLGIGPSALQNVTTGYENVGVGVGAAGGYTSTGYDNTSVGSWSLYNNTTGHDNVALGESALNGGPSGTFTGNFNTAVGDSSLDTTAAGSYNTALGYQADVINDNVQGATAIGSGALAGSGNSVILGYGLANSTSNTVGIGTSFAPNELTVAPQTYGTDGTSCSSATITQSASTTVVASAACFVNGMIGGTIYYSDGTSDTIAGYTDSTHITTSGSHSESGTFNIVFGGFNVNSNGAAYLQPASNSTTAFQVQNAGSGAVLNVDTTNQSLTVTGAGNPAVPTGSVGSATTGSGPDSVAVAGDYAYVVNNSSATLQIFNISNPASPTWVGSAATGTTPYSVAVSGNYAYVANGFSNTLQVFNVSNPASPTSVATVSTGNAPYSVAVSGNYAYVANESSSTLQIFNISNPASPTSLATVSTSGNPRSVAVSGNYAYVANQGANNLQIFNVSNPASPTSVGTASTGSSPYSVAVSGNYAYVANWGANTLQVFNVSNPASPSSVGSASTGNYPLSVAVSGNYVYVANQYSNTLQTFNVSNPASPTSVGTASTGTWPYSVAVSGNYAYVVNYTSGTLQTFNVNAAPTLQIENSTGTDVLSVDATGAGNLFSLNNGTAGADTNVLAISDNGAATFQNSANSTAAFQVQNASAADLLQVDTTNNVISLDGNNSGATGAWTTNANALPTALTCATSVTANGYIYEIGGNTKFCNNNSGAAVSTVYYAKLNSNGSVGAWSTGANSLPAVRDCATSVVANGYVYVMGGGNADSNNGCGNSSQSTVYFAKLNSDGTTGAWQTNGNALPQGLCSPTSITANGYVYVMGGSTCGGAAQSTVYYAKVNPDGSLGSWTTNTNALTQALACATAVTANGYVYVMGGNTSASSSCTGTDVNTVYYAQLNSNGSVGTWTTNTNALPSNLIGATSVVADGYVYVLGGANGNVSANSTVYYGQLNSSTGSVGTWSTNTNNLPAGRACATSAMANGYIYVMGGNSTGCVVNGNGTVNSNVYYASLARVTVGANLDLLGDQGGNLSNPGDQSDGSTGGSLTAGNGLFVGSLQVQGAASFAQGVNVNGVVTIGSGSPNGTVANSQAALFVGTNGTRSINASGTINASGADYSEYIPWSGPVPDPGSIVTYNGSAYVVSSQQTAGFVGNDVLGGQENIMVTFVGQVPTKVTGPVNVGDLLVNNGDGTARAVDPAQATVGDYLSKVGIAEQSAGGSGVNVVEASIGTTDANVNSGLQQASSDFQDINVSGLATVNNLTVTGAATLASLHVTGSAQFDGDITIAGHVITAGGQPTVAVAAAAGSSASCSVSGNDTGGQITIVTGTAGWTAGTQCTINFANGYASAPHPVIAAANNSNAGAVQPYVDSTNAAFTINFINPDNAQHTFKFNYFNAQ